MSHANFGIPNSFSDNAAVQDLKKRWTSEARWKNIRRDYSAEDVIRLRASLRVEYTIAKRGAERLWHLLQNESYVNSLGALNGSQAVQMVKAGLKSIYLSGWQVAADANLSGQTYPDQSLYPSNSVPALVKRLNNALMRMDQITAVEGDRKTDWYVPILADAEAGFGGPLHAFELMKSMIEAGAAAVHYEDQLASEKKCGHLGGKVLVPTSQFVRTLAGARLAADVLDVPTLIVARTDALGATLMTADIDERDQKFLLRDKSGNLERTPEGYYRVRDGMEPTLARGLAYAPYADLVWFETSKPDMAEAERFAKTIHETFPGKLLAYNCSPSFNWKKNLDDKQIASFQKDLAQLGYKYQFITLAGWHSINLDAFKLASGYAKDGMTSYVKLQEEEFALEKSGYTAARHQREVGTGYFDHVLMALSGGQASTSALKGSTEADQFKH